VHDARKELKKLRAVFRLARTALRDRDSRPVAEAMRLAAKPLGPIRDARVTEQALCKASGDDATRRFPQTAAALEARSHDENRRFTDSDANAVAQLVLQALRGQLRGLKLKRCHGSDLIACLRQSYRRTRRAYHLAVQSPTPPHLHAWRKRAKVLGYQLDFTCPHWPPRTRALKEGLEKLGDQLGDDHDLVLLQQFITKHSGHETATLKRSIEQLHEKLAADAFRLGSDLFSRPASEVGTQLKKDWKRWRG